MKILEIIQDNWKNLLLSIVITLFLISLSNAQAAAADLNVSLSYREMIALGPEAEARLMLVDPTQPKAELILRDLNKKLDGVPIDFKLNLSETEVDLAANYQLLAVIKAGREMVWSASKNFSGSQLLQQRNIEMLVKRKPAKFLSFTGEKNLKVKFLEGMAQVIIADKEYILPQQRTASGAKFSNSELSIWNKGRELWLEKDNHSYQTSLISLANIKTETAVIRARGQEPYWEIKIDKNGLNLRYDYLTNKIIIPKTNINITKKDNSLVYKVNTTFLDFELEISEDIHVDVMNGKIYPLTAFIKVDDEKYIGGADLQ